MESEARIKVASLMSDWLRGGRVVVTDGQASASAPAAIAINGATIVVTAVFDEQAANFHWLRREVRADDGTLVDALDEDYGLKAVGAVWTLEVPLEVE